MEDYQSIGMLYLIAKIWPYLIAILTIIITVLGWIIHRKTERIKIIENQISEKKYNAYADVVQFFYDSLQDIRNGKTFDLKKAENRMMASKRDILMYASDNVFKAFNDYLCSSTNNSENKPSALLIKCLLKLLLEIRKDMCGKRTSIKEKDILLNLMQNENEVKKYMQLYNTGILKRFLKFL